MSDMVKQIEAVREILKHAEDMVIGKRYGEAIQTMNEVGVALLAITVEMNKVRTT